MRKIAYILLALITLSTANCSSEHDEPAHARPGNSGTDESQQPAPDYSQILSNDHIRFESDTLALDYEDGGILYSVEGAAHRLIELSTGVTIFFNPSAPELTINGEDVRIDSCVAIGSSDRMQWYLIKPGEEILAVENP